ncbi:MAG: oligopeptide:H+ symporter [Rothia sp. (in: high G+C Gram-positive bacteria)]|uniref:peptide MFS transporter n=1 Tax=Rothia sp. (in: high G+C Gram-positive bacteria) TaxID=1885016 RepID=UPI0026DCB95F|nr:oligopeptide:H+ symporter [Rothia sp. (in: high G+C Gram-positive bacteria)]MDO4883401.1 oligopeptide:H+ symporter [Rothia sp. (in: high G+C Gram-positive bacteria)]
MSTTLPAQDKPRTFFGHPGMLANLFTVEMWERFSFYGMQVLMLYYLYYAVADGGLGLDKAGATGVIGAYGAVVYLMAILGGIFGDRILGPERALFYSAIGIMAGHLALAFVPGVPGVVAGLLLVAIGSGGLKSNASVLVGSLYSKEDPKRDAGFTIFYIGVNIGALLGPALTGWGWGWLGFHFGFGIAALGMAAGLIQYALTRKHLPESVHEVALPFTAHQRRIFIGILAAFAALVVAMVVLGIMTPNNLKNWVMGAIALGAVGLFTQLLTAKNVTGDERSRVWAFIPLWIANAVFWGLYQQQFTVMAVYSDERLNWNILGFQFPPTMMNSINPTFIIILGVGFAAMWTKLGEKQPFTTTKFSIALVVIGFAFWIFLAQAGVQSVNVMWIVLILFVCTLAELTISPVGTSLTTKLAPEAYKVNMMALYWTSVAMGTVLSGWLAQFYSFETEVPYFSWMGVTAIVTGIMLFLCRKPVQKLMRGVK